MYGYHGCYWRIDLSRGTGERVAIWPETFRRVIGGVGLGAWLMLAECPAGADPFDPACPVVLAFAPLVGSPLPGTARFAVVTRSPLTGLLSDSLCSSPLAAAGKGTGADAIVLAGACAGLSVLLLEAEGARIEPAADLAGLSPEATAERVRVRWGERFAVAAIGLAGENRVRFAALASAGRHAGRGGAGAVLGAKRLKAIAVAGERPTAFADPAALEALAVGIVGAQAGPEQSKYRTTGTLGTLRELHRRGLLPGRNFREPAAPGAERLYAENLARGGEVSRAPSADGAGVEWRFAGAGGASGRLEYENVFALGPLTGLEAPGAVQAAIARCDAHGLDTISAGATLAFAMECRERGLLVPGGSTPAGERVPAGWELAFGDGAATLSALDAIAHREGIGNWLAEGTRRLARRLGPEAETFAPHVKGLELPGYDPRAVQTLALGLAVGARGADHNKSGAYDADLAGGTDRLALSETSARAAMEAEDAAAAMDSLILSKFLRKAVPGYDERAALLEAATGLGLDGEALRAAARGIIDLKKRFNQRHGWRAEDDTLPARFFEESQDAGGRARPGIDRERFRAAVRAYYRLRGWNAEGRVADP